MMLIKTAENCGFCFGVRRAVDVLQAELDKGVKIYLLGRIIHNNIFLKDLERRSVTIIEDEKINKVCEQLKQIENIDLKSVFGFEENASVVIRAHGIPKILFAELKKLENIDIIDATCKCVKKMHVIARENTSEQTRTIIFGDSNHPEIIGLDSYITGEREFFADFGQFKNNFNNNQKKLIILAQTTHNIDDWKKAKDFIKASGESANAVFFDTICGATDKRQKEAEILSKECDIMLVIGGRNSSNTKRLFEICKKNCAKSFIIETSEQLPLDIIISESRGHRAVKVGITAGASTPDGIIKEVKTFMAEESTKINGGVSDNEQSFEDMLNESFVTLNRGERVKGIVSLISGSEIYVDLGGKYTGILAFDEITDDTSANVKEMFKVGDEIETQIIKTNDQEGTALLSRKRIDSNDNWDKIIKYSEDATTAEGKVVQVVNGGIIVLVEAVKVFVPASHANVSKDTDLHTLITKKVKVKIIDVNQQKRRAIASIRYAENEHRRAQEEKIWGEIEHGKKYEGVVKSIANYGAFVDIGGVDGMVHITELSWTRIKHPSEVIKIGDKIQVYIKDFDPEKRRISLGYKDESENPWTKFLLERQLNDIVEAKISSVMPFGAFAEIIPGVDGLIHISEITDKRISKPTEVVNIGDTVKVKITKIDAEGKKLSLSILAAEEPVQAQAEKIEEITAHSEEAINAAEAQTKE